MKNTYTKLLTGIVVLGLYTGTVSVADDAAKPPKDDKATAEKNHCKTGGHCAGKQKKGAKGEQKPGDASQTEAPKPQ